MSSEWDNFVEEYKALNASGQQRKWRGLSDQQRGHLTATYGLQAPEIEQQPVSFWKKRSTWIGIGIFLALGGILRLIEGPPEPKEEASSPAVIEDIQPEPTEAEVAEACRKDLRCWGEEHLAEARVYCKDSIERLAKYDFEWTDGFLGSKFMRWRWTDSATRPRVITYIGEKIKFQNGFGAFIHHRYECDFDTSLGRPIDARATPR